MPKRRKAAAPTRAEEAAAPSHIYGALQGALMGAGAAMAVIAVAVAVIGMPQPPGTTPPPPSPPPSPLPAPAPHGTIPTANEKKPERRAEVATPPPPPPRGDAPLPAGSWRNPDASRELIAASNKINELQAMWGTVDYDEKAARRLVKQIRQGLAAVDRQYGVAPRAEWKEEVGVAAYGVTYFAYARARLRLELFRETRDFSKAYDAAMDALRNPMCEPRECANTVLRSAMTLAHRAADPAAAAAALEFVRAEPRYASALTIGSHWKYPDMPEVDLKVGADPVKVVTKPFWTNEVPLLELPARMEREAAVVADELKNILKPDGSFVDVHGRDKFTRDRELQGFLPNARELCDEQNTGPHQCWQEFILYAAEKTDSKGGHWSDAHCKLTPRTCAMLQHRSLIGAPPGLAHNGIPGKASFIRLKAGRRILKHCGPHPYRLTCHLGLRIPDGATIQVYDEEQAWADGRVTILDDAFVHGVYNANTTHDRYILLFHIWHPSLIEQVGWENEAAAPYAGAIEYVDESDEGETVAAAAAYAAAHDDDDDDTMPPPINDDGGESAGWGSADGDTDDDDD
mmetsp:Transcript_28379/g.74537  ORF Transcript_28379/g.74537 Transcript_28379/m.74537 type:complete len:572 (-) Transcript_28379:329-2044(-)